MNKEKLRADYLKYQEKPLFLNIPIGKTPEGEIKTFNLSKHPHILMGGAVGGGKSSFLRMMITTLISQAKPDEVKLILSDIKRVEFHDFKDSPHLLQPVIYDIKKSADVFPWLVEEMHKRHTLFKEKKVENIEEYNERMRGNDDKKGELPYIVYIVDEFSNVMLEDPEVVEGCIVELAKESKGTGICFVICTQRPSENLFTEAMREVVDTRVCAHVASKGDSVVVLGEEGAEKLLGKGDLMFRFGGEVVRVQVPWVDG